MTALVLLNGPPAAGKSTLADRLVETMPLALNLDIDVVRSHLGGWLDDPMRAGLAARRLALAMAREHLACGHGVIVPQFLGRTDFIEQLELLADEVSVPFIEVMLDLDRPTAIDAFAVRAANPQNQTHHDAAALVARSTSSDPVGEMFDALTSICQARPNTIMVRVTRGDVAQTLDELVSALRDAGVVGLVRATS